MSTGINSVFAVIKIRLVSGSAENEEMLKTGRKGLSYIDTTPSIILVFCPFVLSVLWLDYMVCYSALS